LKYKGRAKTGNECMAEKEIKNADDEETDNTYVSDKGHTYQWGQITQKKTL
jgi:hypothetical protein